MNEKLSRDKNDMTDDMVTVLKMVVLEMSIKLIAKKSGININTVKAAIGDLYVLFDVKTSAGLTRVALQLGYYVETRDWRA